MRQLETSKSVVEEEQKYNMSARGGPSQSQVETTDCTTVMSITSNQKVITILTTL